MNKERRKRISKVFSVINEIKKELQRIVDEEQDYYDNIPENLQCSDRAATSETAIDLLTESLELLDDITNNLNEV